eukprot:PhF_6_TR7021/c0_g2_i2/m.10455
MCHGAGVPAVSGAALLGICLVLSPVLVPAAIVGGTYYGTKAAVTATKKKSAEIRTSNVIMKARNRAIKSVGAAKFNEYLQEIHARSKQFPTTANICELAVAMYASNDFFAAEEIARDAIASAKDGATDIPTMDALGLAYYIHGIALQAFPNYEEASVSFEKCAKLWEQVPESRVRVNATKDKLRITLSDAYNSIGFCQQRIVLNGGGDDAERAALYDKSIALHTQAIETSEDLQGMYYHSRAVAKYFRALIAVKWEDDGISWKNADKGLLKSAVEDWDVAIGSANFGTTAEAHSMKSQAYRLLGDYALAQECLQKAKDLDPKVFTIDFSGTDMSSALLYSWPIPKVLFEGHRDSHDWGPGISLHHPTWCDHCMKFITPLQNMKGNIKRCNRCRFTCHAECHSHVKAKICWKAYSVGLNCGDRVSHKAFEGMTGTVDDVNQSDVIVKWDSNGQNETLRAYHLTVLTHSDEGVAPAEVTHTHH